MAYYDPLELKRIDREIKIAELKEEAAARGEYFDDDYWTMVYNFEYAPFTSGYELLAEEGIVLPDPDDMDDDELTAKLWEIIEYFAGRRIYLSCTDHLSDRELYETLVTDLLHEAWRDVELTDGESWEIDILGSGSEEDMELYFRYYIDESDRTYWGELCANMPARQEPPYDRDRFLPRAERDDIDSA